MKKETQKVKEWAQVIRGIERAVLACAKEMDNAFYGMTNDYDFCPKLERFLMQYIVKNKIVEGSTHHE
jgi:hypothetical protein